MTLVRCHFAHRADIIANRWFHVGPTPLPQQALHMPFLVPVPRWANVGDCMMCRSRNDNSKWRLTYDNFFYQSL